MPKTSKTTKANTRTGTATTSKRTKPETATPRRQSSTRRVRAAAGAAAGAAVGAAGAVAAGEKSPYFEHPSEDDEEDDAVQSESGSEFDDDGHDSSSSNRVKQRQPPPGSSSSLSSRKRARTWASDAATGATATPGGVGKTGKQERPQEQRRKRMRKKQEKQEYGDDDEQDSQDERGEIFIPNRPPSLGGIDYADDQIHPNTLRFLEDLAENNDRNWLREHDSAYRAGKSDFEKFVEHINAAMAERVDDTIPELPIKDLVFRIHRDIRFSNDHTPYKTHFSAAWSRTGRKGPYACYYLQIKPRQSVAGGGLWHPESHALNLIRQSVDQHPERLKSVLVDHDFASEFLSSSQKSSSSSSVQAFAQRNAEDALKTAPKNYPKDHKDIELLRLKSFTVGKAFTDAEVVSSDFSDRVLAAFKHMEPLITYLNDCVMPDLNSDGDGDEH